MQSTTASPEQTDPHDLDWNADYLMITSDNMPESPLTDAEWLDALIYDGPGISDTLVNSDTYHLRIGSPPQIVGVRFEYEFDERGRITALGTVHSAAETARGDLHTHLDTNLGERKIVVLLKSPETRAYVSTQIEAMTGDDGRRPTEQEPSDREMELAACGEFPDDMDYSATYALVPRESAERAVIQETLWTQALRRSEESVESNLTSPVPYFVEIEPHRAMVGFFYRFGIDESQNPYADITCHPAHQTDLLKSAYRQQDGEPALDRRRIYFLPDSERTRLLIAAYLRALAGNGR